MSKLKKKMAGWFLKLARKCDNGVVLDATIPMPPMNMISYDKYHIDHIRAQHQIANVELNSYSNVMNVDEVIKRRLTEAISEQIYKTYVDDIKKEQMTDSPWNESTLYSLDLYICKPQKKEGDI